ncbi:hypothetical protein ACOP1M_12585 [Staphylococcus warneri]|uniref:hypothetical protein n=1 Tax=Staphylococcus warneri TaxID=1292 RepID=UPI0034CECCA3
MKDVNLYKRLIIQSKVNDCRNLILNDDPKRKRALFTHEEKANFFELGINLKTFLSNNKKIGENISTVKLAEDYFHEPSKTIQNVFFSIEARGVSKKNTLSLLDKIEEIADENFGTIEQAQNEEKEAVCS